MFFLIGGQTLIRVLAFLRRRDPGLGEGTASSSECLAQRGRGRSRSEVLSASQVPVFIIKATFLRFFGGQALITGKSKHQRKILI